MKVFITGSNGLLGQYLVQAFLQDPRYQIVATGRGENRLRQQAGYVYEPLELTQQAAVQACLEKHAPAIIIHAGAMSQVDDCERDKAACWAANVDATSYLLQAALPLHAFFLQLSTDFIFDGLAGPYRENDLPHPINNYGASKVAAERLVMQSGLAWAIVRTVLVYGVADDLRRSNFITWVKQNLEQGNPIKVVNDQWRTPTLVQDLARGCKLVADQRANGVYNISGSELLTPYQMALKVAAFLKLDAGLLQEVTAQTFTQVGARPARTGFIIEKARKVLGYQPKSFAEGLEIVAGQLQASSQA
ncbi:dTDP-4-dehydrorhamnose reductase [Chitinophaga costaii]|uniref:dTDP-4-dehydrorhamnose reductase n=1 Tax=Chitinophaga costaii TaxID=1335309 RepID=A0A1C4FV91_9BACT|nr:SDR family oxidoreductase [Chitinophaga costaii]PUZ27245.1 SDR family NAD(P)-dependent oxidoreductase [Chitinophaga costaii]SCC59840.1 dTDP-4-dehydrorhamnose reductase [Chitinophaga costaii]